MLATWSMRVDFAAIGGMPDRLPLAGIEQVLDTRVVSLPSDVPLPVSVHVNANPLEFWDGFYVNGGDSHGFNEELPWENVDTRLITVDLVDGDGGSAGGWVELSLTYTPVTGTPGTGTGTASADPGYEGDVCDRCPTVSPTPSDGVLRYYDGPAVSGVSNGLGSGVGLDWDPTRSANPGVAPWFGPGWAPTAAPTLSTEGNDPANPTHVAIAFGGTDTRVFQNVAASGNPPAFHRASGHGSTDKLTLAGGQYVFRTATGSTFTFNGHGSSIPVAARGQLISRIDASGNGYTYTFNADGTTSRLTSTLFGQATALELQDYAYNPSTDPNAGKVARIDIKRGDGTLVRSVHYGYSTGGHSPAGNLTSVTVRDASGALLDTRHYRYTNGPNGVSLLQYTFDPESVRRAEAAGIAMATASNATVAPFATNYYQYDAQGRVTLQKSQGTGCSACTGGIGTYIYSYAPNPAPVVDANRDWRTKFTETRPDGTQRILYSNARTQPMLEVIRTTEAGVTKQYGTYFRYDARGQLIWKASPEAVELPAILTTLEAFPDLLNEEVNGNFEYIRDTSGLIEVMTYGQATSGGDANRFLKSAGVQLGELGTPSTQAAFTYIVHSGGASSVTLVASSTTYPTSPTPTNPTPADRQTTTFSYTFASNSTRVTGQLTTLPAVATGQNGPGTTASVVDRRFDAAGREIWLKDPDGFLHYTEYDTDAGVAVKSITDVNHTLTGDFQNLPSGWAAPGSSPLRIISSAEVDRLGRPVKLTDPNDNITYTVYDDINRSTRVYRGWNAGTTTGPIEVFRRDVSGTYTESMTYFSPAIAVAQDRPTGGEAITHLQSLTRSHMNNAGQVTAVDRYRIPFNVTYTTNPIPGALRTTYGYNNQGRISSTTTPAGTITSYVYDGLARLKSTSIGTSSWNKVQVAAYEYDNNGVGNGNLTKITEYPQDGQPPRTTVARYDWRNRVVAVKEGAGTSPGSEATSVNRPLTYLGYDNLDRITATRLYDGDGVDIVTAPAASLLREQRTLLYDSLDRVYRAHEHFVNQGNGDVAPAPNVLTTDVFYDRRGNVAAVYAPTSPVTQARYDGAGRLVADYTLGNIPALTWANATSSTLGASVVVEQNNYTYDAASNLIGATNRRRFHDASTSATGPLGAGGIPVRASFVTNYFDRANRITATVDVGTNGGVGYSRPPTVPGRSDNFLVTSYGYDAAGNVVDVTDPRGKITRTGRDAMGNAVSTILNFTGGSPGAQTDVTTYFMFDSVGRLAQRIAAQPAGTPHQFTTYQYGVSLATGSPIASNDIVWRTLHPDPVTGLSTAAEADTYTVNALGERTSFVDRAGSTRAFSYDVIGRLTTDRVTAFGAGVDTAVQRLEYLYDVHGRMTLASSFSAATGGTASNQVARGFSGFGQLINEWQAHTGGAVAGVTPVVNYVYTNAGGGNHSRLARINYPSGFALDYVYTSTTIDAAMNRPSLLWGPRADSGAAIPLEAFKYLGASTVIERARSEINTTLSMVSPTGAPGSAGDKYTGLDRFGRVVVQRWANGPGGTGAIVAQNAYSYDRNGNRLTDSIYGANYTYDDLNQVQSFTRAAWAPGLESQEFAFDALGNWNTLTTDGSAQSRVTNAQNEVTNVGGTTLVYSPVGNMLVDTEGRLLRYDAWNRLVTVSDSDQYATLLARYQYDALNRRITEQVGTPAVPNAALAPVRDLYYSDQWQVLEERVRTTPGVVASTADTRYIWSPVYVDALVARDRNADGNAATGTGGLEERVYALQDANWNTHAIVAASGVPGYAAGQVINRFIYTPFGTHEVLDAGYLATAPAIPWDRLFQGHEYTDITKLTHMRNRDFSASLGRFVQRDPIGFAAGDNNVYRFVGNGPTGKVDPSGLAERSWIGWLLGYPAKQEESPLQQGMRERRLANLQLNPTSAGEIHAATRFGGSLPEGALDIAEGCGTELATMAIPGTLDDGLVDSYRAGRAGNAIAKRADDVVKKADNVACAVSKGLADAGAVRGIRAAGTFNSTAKSLDDALATMKQAMPDAVELPRAVAGKPYPSPLPGVKKWFQIHPPEPSVGNNLPHIKYEDWTNGKKGTGGSWGHIFFPE